MCFLCPFRVPPSVRQMIGCGSVAAERSSAPASGAVSPEAWVISLRYRLSLLYVCGYIFVSLVVCRPCGFVVLACCTQGFLPDLSALCRHHLLMGRVWLLPRLGGGRLRRAVLWLALGDFLLSNGTKRGLEDFLVCGGRFLGANHFPFGRPCFPFEFQLSTGLLPPRPAARWFSLWGFDA